MLSQPVTLRKSIRHTQEILSANVRQTSISSRVRTLRKAIASAPHCVTTRVSLVSRVSVNAMIIKNFMDPMSRNFIVSCFP